MIKYRFISSLPLKRASTAMWADAHQREPRITLWGRAHWNFCNSTPVMGQSNMENFYSYVRFPSLNTHWTLSTNQVIFKSFSEATPRSCCHLSCTRRKTWREVSAARYKLKKHTYPRMHEQLFHKCSNPLCNQLLQ